MIYNAATKSLTVTPGAADFGSYALEISYSTIFDGLAPSLKSQSFVFIIYKLEIGSGTILDQTYYISAPSLTLLLPTIVTNPAGNPTSITWSASPMPAWLS